MALEFYPLVSVAHPVKALFYALLVPLGVYSLRFYAFALASLWLQRPPRYADVPEKDLPRVTVQIPVYNDPVVKTCIEESLAFDYPRDKMEIIVADDSTDDTVEVLKGFKGNPQVKILRRPSREGFKAGALNNALRHSTGDIIVIFDSDYRLQKDFLRKIVRPFHWNERVGFVQTKWGYLNPNENAVTNVATISYSGFHNCSLPVQMRLGSAIFCGSGGAVRKKALEEVNGWNESSITEDLDMSIRVLEKGWKQEYLPDLVAVGEVPSTLRSYVRQQQRWAYGTTKALVDYLDMVLASKNMTFLQKADFSFLLTAFLVFPFIMGVMASSLVASNPMFGYEKYFIGTTPSELHLQAVGFYHSVLATVFSQETLLIFVSTSGFLFLSITSIALDRNWKALKHVPSMYAVGVVVQFYNSLSVFHALLGVPQGFYKTPKKPVTVS